MRFFPLFLLFLFPWGFLPAANEAFPIRKNQIREVELDSYRVSIVGIECPDLQNSIEKNSYLLRFRDKPLKKPSSLKRRAVKDMRRIKEVLISKGYFSGKVSYVIEDHEGHYHVIVSVEEGPLFLLKDVEIVSDNEEIPFPLPQLTSVDLSLSLETPALPKNLIDAETALLKLLAEAGYPLAKITKKETIANRKTAYVIYRLTVDAGPLCRFGSISFIGNQRTCREYIARKIAWEEGSTFQICKIEKTRANLEESALFDAVDIRFEKEFLSEGVLPIVIEVSESEQRSLGLGASYTTIHGAGILFEWQHRNVRGLAERIDVKTRILENLQEGLISYTKPDFLVKKQNLVFLAELEREETKSFDESYISLSVLLQRRINRFFNASLGVALKELKSTSFEGKNWFFLLKFPLQLRWSRVNNVLDPTHGVAITFLSTPSFQMKGDPFFYSINTLTTAFYYPLDCDPSLSFAFKSSFGSIYGANRKAIPVSERYFLGSDTALRGYRFLTVSPMIGDHPIGGRSLLLSSFEIRKKWNSNWGTVLFYDVGNTFLESLFPLNQKVRQSVGFGIRYFTPVGPLRFDLAFPLNPRKHLDHRMEFYVSIGQAF